MAATTTARLTINPDTTDEIVLAGSRDDGADVPSARRRRRWWLVPLAVLAVAAIVAAFIRLPYDTIAPGTTRQVNDLVVVRGAPSYPPKGEVLYTTVSVRERVSPYELLIGWIDSDVSVVSDKSVRGSTPPKQFQQENVAAMTDSKKVAEAVALEHLGYHVVQGNGAVIRTVQPGSPAASILRPGDIIVAVDGKPVAIETQAVEGIKAHKPGDRVTLSIVRGTAPPATASATLAPGPDGKGLLGVVLETSGLQFKLPFQIDIVAYSLELLDLLTPGELTGGAKVAATGDLRLDGTVGAIGGVAQKTVTVGRAGASIFLVPRDNYAEAKAHAASGLRVYPIDKIDDALHVLGSLKGSNALALARPAAGT
jgi:PDZ domain-containing protein